MKKGRKDSGQPAKNGQAAPTAKGDTPESKAVVIPSASASIWRRTLRRRLPWLLLIACLIGVSGILIERYQKANRPGEIVYNSDDPEAQVILTKDGQDTPLKKGTSSKMAIPPGYYTTRLEASDSNLKLHQTFVNLDPGGRAFVKVTREEQAPKKP